MCGSLRLKPQKVRALNLDINACAETGTVAAIDKAMTKHRWGIEQRIALKSALSKIGVLD